MRYTPRVPRVPKPYKYPKCTFPAYMKKKFSIFLHQTKTYQKQQSTQNPEQNQWSSHVSLSDKLFMALFELEHTQRSHLNQLEVYSQIYEKYIITPLHSSITLYLPIVVVHFPHHIRLLHLVHPHLGFHLSVN